MQRNYLVSKNNNQLCHEIKYTSALCDCTIGKGWGKKTYSPWANAKLQRQYEPVNLLISSGNRAGAARKHYFRQKCFSIIEIISLKTQINTSLKNKQTNKQNYAALLFSTELQTEFHACHLSSYVSYYIPLCSSRVSSKGRLSVEV